MGARLSTPIVRSLLLPSKRTPYGLNIFNYEDIVPYFRALLSARRGIFLDGDERRVAELFILTQAIRAYVSAEYVVVVDIERLVGQR